MGGPERDIRQAKRLGPCSITTIFVPAHPIRLWLSLLQESAQILLIVLIIDGANKFTLRSELFQCGNYRIPGNGITISWDAGQVCFIAIFIVNSTLSEDGIHDFDDLCIVL